MDTKRAIGELKYETKLIVELLEHAQIGETITNDMISDLIGQDIQKHRYLLETAKRVVQRDSGIVFDTIWRVGIVRVTEGGKSLVVDKGVGKIRRATRRTRKVLDTVDTASLEQDELNRHMQQCSGVGVLEAHTAPSRKKEPKPQMGNGNISNTVQQVLEKHRKLSNVT